MSQDNKITRYSSISFSFSFHSGRHFLHHRVVIVLLRVNFSGVTFSEHWARGGSLYGGGPLSNKTSSQVGQGRNSIAIPSFRIILRIILRIAIELNQFQEWFWEWFWDWNLGHTAERTCTNYQFQNHSQTEHFGMILRIILRSLVVNSIAILRMILKLGIPIELRPRSRTYPPSPPSFSLRRKCHLGSVRDPRTLGY